MRQVGYCYSCNWKREELERVQLDTLVTATATNSAILEKYPPATILIEQSSSSQQQQQ
jgi:hypothetical protein